MLMQYLNLPQQFIAFSHVAWIVVEGNFLRNARRELKFRNASDYSSFYEWNHSEDRIWT
jgi:hypothetical protein